MQTQEFEEKEWRTENFLSIQSCLELVPAFRITKGITNE